MASTGPSTSTLPLLPSSSTSAGSLASGSTILPERGRKRRIEDVISSVDEALAPVHDQESLSRPAKRFHASRSLYSTLAKYGIDTKSSSTSIAPSTSKSETLSKAPNLSAIIARTASRTRKAMSFKATPSTQSIAPSPSTKDFSPSNVGSFLARLATFKLATYANKPSQVDAVAAARYGWVNEGKDRLVCHICNASWVVAGREGMSREAANALTEKQQSNLVSSHKNLCPWRTRQCDASIYRIPLRPPGAMAKDLKSRSLELEPVIANVKIIHPLTPSHITSLMSTLSSINVSGELDVDLSAAVASSASSTSRASSPTHMPSETAIIASLFGWTVAPPTAPSERPAFSRSQSVQLGSPALSRSSSVASLPSSRASTPGPVSSISRRIDLSGFRRVSTSKQAEKKPEQPMVHCMMCQRKLGLWSFAQNAPEIAPMDTSAAPSPVSNGGDVITANSISTDATTAAPTVAVSTSSARKTTGPPRPFDIMREHRAFCPYIVKSTTLPSLPVDRPVASHARTASEPAVPAAMENAALEGWRAVLAVVCRYRLAQRQLGLARSATFSSLRSGLSEAALGGSQEGRGDGAVQDVPMEVDHVEAMVDRVKARGGRELLKYVKGLLG